MDDQVVFAVDRAMTIGEGKWRVDGRAYQDVKVGDVVTICASNEAGASTLVVTNIMAYSRDIPEINRGLTGSLTLEGANDVFLKDVRALLCST